MDFAAMVAPANGNGNGHAAQGTHESGQVAWGPLNGNGRNGLEVIAFSIALEAELK
jgi:hypothetical protein